MWKDIDDETDDFSDMPIYCDHKNHRIQIVEDKLAKPPVWRVFINNVQYPEFANQDMDAAMQAGIAKVDSLSPGTVIR